MSAKMTPLTSVGTDGDRDQGRSTGESVKAEDSPWCIWGDKKVLSAQHNLPSAPVASRTLGRNTGNRQAHEAQGRPASKHVFPTMLWDEDLIVPFFRPTSFLPKRSSFCDKKRDQ